MEKLKLLLGGSPCTYWSIAQTKNRETVPSGKGWKLFLNYKIALEKYQPAYFLYENNKSMAKAIRAQITKELGVEPIEINSALVSAQSRRRLYWTNIPGVQQPEDRGILLRDILESGVCWREKAYTLRAAIGAHGGPSSVLKTIEDFDSQQYRVYSPDGNSVTLCDQGGVGAKTGLYAVPAGMAWRGRGGSSAYEIRDDQKANSVTAEGHQSRLVIEAADGKTSPVYEVRDGQITIKGQRYPIKLTDGFYIIRKLTVRECMRLQTVPEDYIFPVSDTQAYKMLGNGWTVDVIAHILSCCPGITLAPLEVLSMYDGMSCGHIALDKLGAHVRRYYATEIDKYAIKTTQANFPDTIQLGDADQVGRGIWNIF